MDYVIVCIRKKYRTRKVTLVVDPMSLKPERFASHQQAMDRIESLYQSQSRLDAREDDGRMYRVGHIDRLPYALREEMLT